MARRKTRDTNQPINRPPAGFNWRLTGVSALLASLLLLSACGNSERQTVTITGSSTIAPVVAELARIYETQHDGIRIDVQTGGSSRGLNDVQNGTADIGMVSKAIKPSPKLKPQLLARDGLAIIVHASNPVAELQASDIMAFYRGAKKSWADGKPVSIVHKADGRSTQDVFLKHFKLKTTEIKADAIVGDNEQGIKTVAANPSAIGYVSIGAAQNAVDSGVAIKLLPLNGIEASVANVANGRYPLARELNLVTSNSSNPAANAFLRFTLGPDAAKTISRFYFVPITNEQPKGI